MRKFYQLIPNTDIVGYEYVEKYELYNFDYQSLLSGRAVDSEEMRGIKLYVKDKNLAPVDFMINPLSWLIISSRFFNLIKSKINSDIQVLDPCLFSESIGKKAGYYLINVLRKNDCIDSKNTDFIPGPNNNRIAVNIVVQPQLIPSNVNMFHIDGSYGVVGVSEEFLSLIQRKGLTGIAMMEITSYY